MFKDTPDRMRTEPTPERVYALGRLIKNQQTCSLKALSEKLEPTWLNSESGVFDEVLEAASELGLIKVVDGTANYVGPDGCIEDFGAFRIYAGREIMKNRRSTFYLFTSWYLEQNEKCFEYPEIDGLRAALPQLLAHVDRAAIRGWRFWSSFLGFGVLHGMFLIPNMAVRIQDTIVWNPPFPVNEVVPFSDLVSWLRECCSEAVQHVDGNRLCLGLSNGLRALHDTNCIQLIYQADSPERWKLFPMHAHMVSEDVSHVVLKGE